MQHLAITIILMISTTILAQESVAIQSNEENATITVTVPKVLSNKGTVNFALYNEEGFMKTPLQVSSSKIVDGKCTIAFENVPFGVYAIICFHDENENKRIDFAENGMPIENYGASNNVFSYGPPNFSDAKFEVKSKEVTLEIKF